MTRTMKNASSTQGVCTSTSAHETSNPVNRYDLSTFHEFFEDVSDPSELAAYLEEMRVEYLELSLLAAEGIHSRGLLCRADAHEHAHEHSYFIGRLIKLLKGLEKVSKTNQNKVS